MAEQTLAWDIFLPIPLLPNNCWYKLTTNPLVTGHRPIKSPSARITPNTTQITGILRGLLRSGYPVTPGFKVADVAPRKEELSNCFLISDKARCIAGSVLELVCAQLWK